MFMFVTIKDLKYYLQRDEFQFPSDVCNAAPGLCKILLQDVVFRIMECDL